MIAFVHTLSFLYSRLSVALCTMGMFRDYLRTQKKCKWGPPYVAHNRYETKKIPHPPSYPPPQHLLTNSIQQPPSEPPPHQTNKLLQPPSESPPQLALNKKFPQRPREPPPLHLLPIVASPTSLVAMATTITNAEQADTESWAWASMLRYAAAKYDRSELFQRQIVVVEHNRYMRNRRQYYQ